MSLSLVITYAGRAALVNAANTGTASVNIGSVGISATSIVASPTTAVLPGEIKRITAIGGTMIADDQIHLTITDETLDVYALRSLAVYLADGTLFASYGQPTPILDKTAGALMLLALDITLLDAAAIAFTFGPAGFVNPPATTTVSGVAELATIAEVEAGTDTQRIVTPAALVAAFAVLLGAVWRPSNDGAGSGLDADLLDGFDASYFTNIIARLGFTPLNVTAYTAADVRAKLLTVDGADSGLDADLLDGQNGSWYADIISRLGYAPANRAGDTFTGPVRLDANYQLRVSGNAALLEWDANDFDAFDRPSNVRFFVINGVTQATLEASGILNARVGFAVNGSNVWHAGNDGAGSGLDADLLDGYHASAFDRIVSADYAEQGGYVVYASGFKRCWGFVDVGGNSTGNFTYPISFDSWAKPSAARQLQTNNFSQNENLGIIGTPGLSSLQLLNAENSTLRMWLTIEGV